MKTELEKQVVRDELLERAAQMRVLPLSQWSQRDPRTLPPGKECAVMSHPNYGEATRLMSGEASGAVNVWLRGHREAWGTLKYTPGLSTYNDHIADSPTEVAELLEKVAANL